MMHTWFECKIQYEKTMENGMNKKVTEPYLVDALSFTEAEARIIEEMTPYISGEFTVSDIKRAKYSELFFAEDALTGLVGFLQGFDGMVFRYGYQTGACGYFCLNAVYFFLYVAHGYVVLFTTEYTEFH